MQPAPEAILDGLRRMGLLAADATASGEPLTGGVSSDIWRVDLPDGPVCVKRALERLRVAAEWRAPVERNLFEARWMRRAGAACPGAVPDLLGQDPATGTLAMAYLPPARYGVWKARLRAGEADPRFAAAVGGRLVRIHAASAAEPRLADEFPTGRIFYDIRLEPYLVAAARAHPDRAAPLLELVETTQRCRCALVHGDVSPKNILCGPDGPVFLDAECATWGDPAFDLAFCLNHLLLKCVWTPAATGQFLACFDLLGAAYLSGVAWERPTALERRAARLLPGLLLARVDGKSPVEYLTQEWTRERVRSVARRLLESPPAQLAQVRQAWAEEFRA